MLRKVLLAATAAFLIASAAVSLRAANIPLFSSTTNPTAAACEESSQNVNCLNSLINNINSGVAGYYAAVIGPIGNTATTVQQTLASVTIPSGTLSVPGTSYRIHAFGTTNADVASRTIVLSFGQNSITTGAWSVASSPWELELLVTAATPTNSVSFGRGSYAALGTILGTTIIGTPVIVGAITVTPTATNDLVDLLTSAQTIKVQTTQGLGATASEVTLEELYIEQVK
jgi:hypothetical protein